MWSATRSALAMMVRVGFTALAETKKLDLVLVEQKIDLPSDPNTMEQINVDQLRNLINQRSVMFSNGKYDITNDVLSAVDAKYKTHK